MAVNVRNLAFFGLVQFNKSTGSRGLTIALTETQGRQQEQDQLSPLPPVSPHQGPAQEELDATACTAAGRWGLLELFGITHSDIGTAFLGVVQNGGLPGNYSGRVCKTAEGYRCINTNCMIRTGFTKVRQGWRFRKYVFWEGYTSFCACSCARSRNSA